MPSGAAPTVGQMCDGMAKKWVPGVLVGLGRFDDEVFLALAAEGGAG